MNKAYQKYVFDDHGLVGKFEAMYQAEDTEGFDAWQARDPRHLRMRIVKEFLADYNFAKVLDLGCGIGSFTQALKRANNQVTGVDIAPTAIEKAKQTYPDIEFAVTPGIYIVPTICRFDLVSVQMVFAYVPEWKDVIRQISTVTDYFVVCEYVPRHTIGSVTSISELEEEFCRWFTTERKCVLNDETLILFGKVK